MTSPPVNGAAAFQRGWLFDTPVMVQDEPGTGPKKQEQFQDI